MSQEYFKTIKPRLIYDLGCGLGYFSNVLSEVYNPAKVIGIDISKAAIDKAKTKFKNLEFFSADLNNLNQLPGTKGNQAKLIVAINSLCYLSEIGAKNLLQLVSKSLGKDGIFIAGIHLPKKMNFGRFIQSLDDARKILNECNLRIILSSEINNSLNTYQDEPLGRYIYFMAKQ